MAYTKPIAESEIQTLIDYLLVNQSATAMDMAKIIHRSHNGIQMLMNRDERFSICTLDNGNKLYSLTPQPGPYDVRYMNGVIHHRQAGAGKGKPHASVPESISLFAMQPWAIRRDAIPDRGYTLQSPRMQAND